MKFLNKLFYDLTVALRHSVKRDGESAFEKMTGRNLNASEFESVELEKTSRGKTVAQNSSETA